MKKIKVVIAGLGDIGGGNSSENLNLKLNHASAILNDQRFNLVGGYDPLDKARERFEILYKVPTFDKLSSLIYETDPQLLVIASPTTTHFSILKQVRDFTNVKFILCEKPIAIKTKGLRKILKKMSKQNQIVLVNYQRRSEIEAKAIFEMIKNNNFGKILGGTGFYSGGYFNNGSHMIDLLEWWFGQKSELNKLIKVSTNFNDYYVTLSLNICSRDFILSSINSNSTSYFEIILQFELIQLRYCAGGNQIYFDNICTDHTYKNFRSMHTSNKPQFVPNGQTLSTVYDELYCAIEGYDSNLISGIDAVKLIERMQGFVKKKWGLVHVSALWR
jgi:predicted dehydrogenase